MLLFEPAHEFGDDLDAEREEKAERDDAVLDTAQIRELTATFFEFAQPAIDVREKRLSVSRDADVAARPLEQRDPGLGFEPPQRPAERRLRHAELLRGARDVLRAADGAEISK